MDFLYYQNTFLFVAFAALSALILLLTSKRGGGQWALTAKQAVQLSNTEHAQFIDIRSAEEFQQSAIPQSKNFPKDSIESNLNMLPKKPLILICNAGRTAQQVAQRLKKNNISPIYWLKGGINDWLAEGFPIKGSTKKPTQTPIKQKKVIK